MSVKVDTIIQCPACGEEWTDANYGYASNYDKLEARCKELEEENNNLKDELKCYTKPMLTSAGQHIKYVGDLNKILKAKFEKCKEQRDVAIKGWFNSSDYRNGFAVARKIDESNKELDSIGSEK